VRVLASPEAVAFVRERGGAVFVWVDELETQGRVRYLEASTESPGVERTFVRMKGAEFDLFLDTGGLQIPDRIDLELTGWRNRRLRATWNGATFAADPRPLADGDGDPEGIEPVR
jgi:hypothetical protein